MKKYLLLMFGIVFINALPLNAQNTQYKIYSDNSVITSVQYTNGNIYQKDFLLFIDMLKSTHPLFAWGVTSSVNINDLREKGYIWAEKCTSKDQLKYYMQFIASSLNDGHTTVSPDFDMNSIYPFSLLIIDEDVYINAIDKNYESYLGKKISRINNYPVKKVLESFRNQISSDNDAYFLDKVVGYMQFFDSWKYNSYCKKDSSLVISFADTSDVVLYQTPKQNIKITSVQSNFKHDLITIRNKQPFSYSILPEKSICYFQFNQCTDQSDIRYKYLMSNKQITQDMEQKISRVPRFDTLVENMFEKIAQQNIKTLVVDVRNNAGGNSKLCNILLSYLKNYKEIKHFSSKIRVSNLWAEQYPLLAEQYSELIADNSFEFGKLYNQDELYIAVNSNKSIQMDDYFRENRDTNKVFKGNVVFIQSPKTFSSAGMLIITAIDNNIGKVIGSESSYKPCSYGDLLAWELPNTNIRGFVSHKIFLRPDTAKCNDNSIVPQIKIRTSIEDMLNGNDSCWNWILENYSK